MKYGAENVIKNEWNICLASICMYKKAFDSIKSTFFFQFGLCQKNENFWLELG